MDSSEHQPIIAVVEQGIQPSPMKPRPPPTLNSRLLRVQGGQHLRFKIKIVLCEPGFLLASCSHATGGPQPPDLEIVRRAGRWMHGLLTFAGRVFNLTQNTVLS